MPRLPILKARDLIRILRDMGFVSVGQKGSHEMFEHPDGRTTEVAHHGDKQEIDRRLLKKILREIEMASEEFMKWL